jgi:hypothetical protein
MWGVCCYSIVDLRSVKEKQVDTSLVGFVRKIDTSDTMDNSFGESPGLPLPRESETTNGTLGIESYSRFCQSTPTPMNTWQGRLQGCSLVVGMMHSDSKGDV